MSIYFLDSSALVKRYAQEQGTAWVESLCDAQNGNTLLIASVTLVEVAAALASKHRSQAITTAEYLQVMQDFIRDAASQYQMIGIDQAVITLGVSLTGRQKLRGYDAIQLAGALTVNRALITQSLPALTLIAADRDLLAAAANEGLSTDDPNQHP